MENASIYGLQTVKRVSLHNRASKKGHQLPKGKYTLPIRQMWPERFWARVSKDADGCWRIAGVPANKAGHVLIVTPQGFRAYAHRISWYLAFGRIPKGQSVLHKCDVPCCVNPAHLFLGSQRDNMLDAVHKGRKNCFGKQKLNAAQVQEIRALAEQGVLQREIAERFGIRRNSVSTIVNRKSWKHVS